MIQPQRISPLNLQARRPGRYVLYWMQAAQRARCNHALEYAIRQANTLNVPVVAFFGLTDSFPSANIRHYHFMLQGLKQVQQELHQRGIALAVQHVSPEQGVLELGRDACLTVTDCGYLRVQRQWREHAAERLRCPMVQVECEAVVPAGVASDKEEWSAATFRRKVCRLIGEYLHPLAETPVRRDSLGLKSGSLDLTYTAEVVKSLQVDRSVEPVPTFTGGPIEARRRMDEFVGKKLLEYPDGRNDPTRDCQSNLSPYLHFGQIAPLEVALAAMQAGKLTPASAGAALAGLTKAREGGKVPARQLAALEFLEQFIVRRELAINFVANNPRYDSLEALPKWAADTLNRHTGDRREYVYSPQEFENALTHDPCWNAAQKEMVLTGKMHNYMRMYWGKKILEWSATSQVAFDMAIYLNDKYELDGRDPSGFAGVLWCFGKHDRPWAQRPIFGTVRYMNDKGLHRKFDTDAYVAKIDSIQSAQAAVHRPLPGVGSLDT